MDIEGSCERSSRSQMSMMPSVRPMKRTAEREGDHAPHEYRHEQNGEEKRHCGHGGYTGVAAKCSRDTSESNCMAGRTHP